MATICAPLNLALPYDAGPDSWNVLPALLGQKHQQPLREGTVCVGTNSLVYSIRKGRWKLVVTADDTYRGKDVPVSGKDAKRTLEAPELFNLEIDPAEEHNLAADDPQTFQELSALLTKYRSQGFTRPGWKCPH